MSIDSKLKLDKLSKVFPYMLKESAGEIEEVLGKVEDGWNTKIVGVITPYTPGIDFKEMGVKQKVLNPTGRIYVNTKGEVLVEHDGVDGMQNVPLDRIELKKVEITEGLLLSVDIKQA